MTHPDALCMNHPELSHTACPSSVECTAVAQADRAERFHNFGVTR